MELKRIEALVLILLTFKAAFTVQTDEVYVREGRAEVIGILNRGNLKVNTENLLSFKAQMYANKWSSLRAFTKDKIDTTMKDGDGVSALFARSDTKYANLENFKRKFGDLAEEILNVVRRRVEDGEILIDIGVGYVRENCSENRAFQRLKEKIGKSLDVHLVTVLIFTRKTPPGVSQTLTGLMEATAKIYTTNLKITQDYIKTAQLWASIHANSEELNKPNVKSTPKEVWVSYTSIAVTEAGNFIRDYFAKYSYLLNGEFPISFAWIRSIDYDYNNGSDKLMESGINSKTGLGNLVIVTCFPSGYTPKQQDSLVRRIPGFQFTKHSPKAAETAFVRCLSLSPIGNNTAKLSDEPVKDSRGKFTVTFTFPVQTGEGVPIPSAQFEFIAKEIGQIDKQIIGAAFGRLMERNLENNEINSITNLVVLLDSSPMSRADIPTDNVGLNSIDVMKYKINRCKTGATK